MEYKLLIEKGTAEIFLYEKDGETTLYFDRDLKPIELEHGAAANPAFKIPITLMPEIAAIFFQIGEKYYFNQEK